MGFILQGACFGFGLYGWLTGQVEFVIISGIIEILIIIWGFMTGALKGLGLSILVAITGTIFIPNFECG